MAELAQVINTFTDILERQTGIYHALLRLAKAKKEILIAGKITELEQLLKEEETFILEAGKVETARQKLVQHLAGQLGCAAEELTLARVRALAGSEWSEKLGQIQSRLGKTLEELKQANQLNNELTQQALAFVNFNLNLLASTHRDSVTYAPSGDTGRPGSPIRLVIDHKV